MQEQSHMFEQGMNLRDLVNVAIKRKKLILCIFFASVILSAIFSFFMPKVYQAEASIMITPSKVQNVLSPSQVNMDFDEKPPQTGAYPTQKPTLSIPTHKSLLKTSAVLGRTIDELKLTDPSGRKLTVEALDNRLSIGEKKDTNVLSLEASAASAKSAKELVNTWAQEYVKYNYELILGEVKGTGDFVTDQFEIVKKNLAGAEQALKEFEASEGLALMNIELSQKQSELNSNYADMYKLEFQVAAQEQNLRNINEDMAAMSIDGKWIGSLDAGSYPDNIYADEKLLSEQRIIRQKILDVKKDLGDATEARNVFVNNSNIRLLREEIGKKRTTLVNDKIALTEIERLYESTEDNINSKGSLEKLKQGQGALSQNLPDSTLWEILSLEEKYNFFRSHRQTLQSKVKEESEELQQFEKKLFDYEKQLGALEEKATSAETNYKFYFDKFKTLEAARNSIELSTRDLKFKLAEVKELVKKLDTDIQSLKKRINQKEAKLTDLQRQAAIYKRSYDNLSAKIEEARIVTAAQLGEVKIVSTAIEPDKPAGPKRRQNVIFAGIFSIIFGIFLAVFIEFLEKTKN